MSKSTIQGSPRRAPGPDIVQFESLDFDVATFDHEAHVYVAWQYLQSCEVLEAIDRYRSTLRVLTRRLGVPEKYNETITWFFVIVIAERVTPVSRVDWEAFRSANPDLFSRQPSLIRAFYSEDLLNSDAAREKFLLPDNVVAAR